MADRQTRRRYLLTLGAVGAVGIAGCSEVDSDGSEPTEEPSTSTEDGTLSASASAEAEATFREYLEAYADGDTETVGSLTHPDSELGSSVEELALTIDEIATTTLSAAAEEADVDLTDEELEAASEAIEDDVSEIGAEQHAVVRYEIETAEFGAESGYALMVRDDGEWSVYSLQVTSYLDEAMESEDTPQQSSDQVTNRLEIVSATGVEINQQEYTVDLVELTVRKAPGAGNIDLGETTLQMVHSSGSYDLVYGGDSSAPNDGEFSVQSVSDDDSSISDSQVLNDPADRAMIRVDVDDVISGESDASYDGNGLEEGSTATIRLNTQSGGTTELRIVVPETLAGSEAVAL